MSIAVSAIVRSSRTLTLLAAAMTVIVLVAAALFWLRPHEIIPAHSRLLLAVVCAITALTAFFTLRASKKSLRIDISATGQIWLTQYRQSADTCSSGQAGTAIEGGSELVNLLGDSTLWSTLMLLRLQARSGQVIVLIILPDSLERSAYRAVCVACRWMVTQNLPHTEKTFDKNPLVD